MRQVGDRVKNAMKTEGTIDSHTLTHDKKPAYRVLWDGELGATYWPWTDADLEDA